jgi:hypothetical protein
MPSQAAAEGNHQQPVPRAQGFGRADAIQITGDLGNRILHKLGGRANVAEKKPRPLTCLRPNLMARLPHILSYRPSCRIDLTVPPKKCSVCTCHHGTIDCFTTKRDSRKLNFSSSQTEVFRYEHEVRFPGNRCTGKRKGSQNARLHRQTTSRVTPGLVLGGTSGGRETVRIAGIEHYLWKLSKIENGMMRPCESVCFRSDFAVCVRHQSTRGG